MRKWMVVLVLAAVGMIAWRARQSAAPPSLPGVKQGREPAAAPRRPTPPPSHRVWRTGLERGYRVTLAATIGAGNAPVALELAGDWRVTVVNGGDVPMVRLALADARVAQNGAPPPAGVVDELQQPWFAELDGDGRIVAGWFDPAVSRASRDLLKSVAALMQYCPPERGACNRSEDDATGTYEATYTQAGRDATTRRKQRYLFVMTSHGLVDTASAHGPTVQASETRFVLDDEAWPTSVAADETMVASLPGRRDAFQARVVLRAERTRAVRNAALADAFTAAAPKLRRIAPLAERPDTRAAVEGMDRQLVDGRSFDELAGALSATDDEHAQARLQRQLSALFRLQPDAARRAAEALRGGLDGDAAKTMMAALGAAGTREAQAALVAALAGAPSTDLRQQALLSLAQTAAPTAQTFDALVAASGAADDDERGTALLALGNVSSRLAAGERDGVALLLERLARAGSDEEAALCLRALGNAADTRALPAIVAALRSPSALVRGSATAALRSLDDPSVNALIARMLGDADASVRAEAVLAASFRPLPPLIAALAVLLRSDGDARVRLRIVALLGDHRTELSQCVALLSWAAANDADEGVRGAAQRALATDPA